MSDTRSATEPQLEQAVEQQPAAEQPAPAEYGGPKGKEPTRYGDWEKNGRCIDF